LLSREDQTLLVRGNALLVLDLGLHIVNSIGGLDLKGDGLARKSLDEAEYLISIYIKIGIARAWQGGWEGPTSAL
jgi:hypothetical protein